jgi:hypothetical protein
MNFACPYQHAQHQILDNELAGWVRRNCPDRQAAPNLFVYRHVLHGTFVIAMWVRPGWFVDVLNLGGSLRSFTRQRARTFLAMFDTDHTVDGFKAIGKESTYAYHRHQTDESSAYHDRFQRAHSSKVQVGYGN